jgi:predicted dehydrogenase
MRSRRSIDRRAFLRAGGAAALLGGAARPAPSPNARIKVGVIGCGSVSRMYLPHLSACAAVELVSVCDKRPERARAAAEKFGVPHHYPHVDDFLAGAAFDLMVNLTDMQEHGRLNRFGLEAGRHVWSEKPLANTVDDGRGLLELARSRGVRIWGAPTVVLSPQFRFMRAQVAEGRLGRVAAAHAAYGHLGPSWSAFFYEEGGGSLPDLGVYNLATLTALLGPARAVTAMTSIVTPRRAVDDKGDIAVEAEDNAMVLIDHGGGTLSHVQCGFNYFDPHGHDGQGRELPTITVTGTGGTMHLVGYDWAPKGVDLATTDHPSLARHATDTQGYVWEMGASHVAECLASGTEPGVSAEHALHVLELIVAAREAQRTGERQEIATSFPWPIGG